ncbi:MAG TPA: hypothetical protein VL691_10365 [Vicinamibacteria bacterium]|nr:hypothetical protein [Vicinamibacteria bacterium]
MNRTWYGLVLLAALAPACQTAGPKASPAPPAPLPDLLRPYEGASRVLVHKGDEPALNLVAGASLAGDCDVAVGVRRVAFEKGTARFALESLGLPKVGERGVRCRRLEPAIQLVFTGFPSGPATPEVTARIDEVLLSPDAYLRAKGIAFDRPPGEAPSEVASQQSDANEGERRLARAVVAWPRRLLSVDATYHGPSKVHFDRLVEVEAVVGTDGRLHRPRVKTSLDPPHEAAVLGVLPFWRFEPARRADAPVGARVSLELSLRGY